jgi:hypothetical protein
MLTAFLALIAQPLPLFAQESETAKEAMPAPPQRLDDDFHEWMIGEWQGTTTSSMGKAQIRLKIEWGLDRQFVVIHETSIFDATVVYKGIGIFTKDPTSGDFIGHWFDNLRGVYKGTGKFEDNKVIMAWESPMGTEARTTEKADEDRMIMTFKTKFSTGNEVEGRTDLTRAVMGMSGVDAFHSLTPVTAPKLDITPLLEPL